jgi:hypothetical protein
MIWISLWLVAMSCAAIGTTAIIVTALDYWRAGRAHEAYVRGLESRAVSRLGNVWVDGQMGPPYEVGAPFINSPWVSNAGERCGVVDEQAKEALR